ncbi:2-dehydropantoate 2-reductase [Synchytrium microbalum]|uniref:2-dehydropantoate 2-reductase n=1 Tax=Synchytrium microbalum TaxID=1806994 RepID=A0A507BZC6_9FUNG|nr:2-dehydropantoate 2-reductase [Synchytrium microbalum]TPX32458.1 2-dehydropantoate 2-reductase [Synchytrium microbalum]
MAEIKPKVCILGAGLVGCWLGGKLELGGLAEVHFVGRQSFLNQITKSGGLGVSSLDGQISQIPVSKLRFHLTVPTDITFDYIVITTKRVGTISALKSITHLDSPSTSIVTMQNGVRPADDIRTVLSKCDIIVGMFPFNVVEQNGVFHQSSSGKLVVEASATGSNFTQLLLRSSVDAVSEADMNGVLYAKLLANLNNSVSALSALPLRDELFTYGYRSIYAKMQVEAMNVYKAAGIVPKGNGPNPATVARVLMLPDWIFRFIFPRIVKIGEKATSSMYEDIKANRMTEVDYLNGEIIRLGKLHNVPAPYNQRVHQLVKQVEASKLGLIKHEPVDIEAFIARTMSSHKM